MAALTAIPQMHVVWGDPEVLSCYSSAYSSTSTERSGATLGKRAHDLAAKSRSLPKELQQYLNHQVAKAGASSASVSSASATSSLTVDDIPRPFRAPGSSLQAAAWASGPAAQAAASSSHPCAADAADGEGVDEDACSEEEPEEQPLGGQASKGSELHDVGKCKPCLYMNSKLGCMNGVECSFCHLPHQKRRRPRPCKSTRMKCKQLANMLDAVCPAPEQIQQVTEELGAQSQYMRTILQGKQKQLAAAKAGGASSANSQPNANAQPDTAGALAGASSSTTSGQPQLSVVKEDGGKKMKLLLSL